MKIQNTQNVLNILLKFFYNQMNILTELLKQYIVFINKKYYCYYFKHLKHFTYF